MAQHGSSRFGSHGSRGDFAAGDHHSSAGHSGRYDGGSSGRAYYAGAGRRDSYQERHEHHSHDWYRSNGWHYDSDYWRSTHQHRYYNDAEACVIIDPAVSVYDSSPQEYAQAEPRPLYQNSGYDSETRAAVQDALTREGYYQGYVDGVIGQETREAIAQYQRDHDLRASGLINEALIQALGLR